MTAPRLILCGGAAPPNADASQDGRRAVVLDTRGAAANVNLKLEDVARVLVGDLTPRLIDFLEIASYVFAADAGTPRGRKWTDDVSTEPWSRDLLFCIAVRDPEFWGQPAVIRTLKHALHFLSDDRVEFLFSRQTEPASAQLYLQFGPTERWSPEKIDRVVMFSGGLDSLAGAVECAQRGERLALVSHRPVASLSRRQVRLVEELRAMFPAVPLLHVPVWVNKDKGLGREHTQRTRSFLFSALGVVVATSVGADTVTFFENGVVSINLPVADEVLRARASRTTHPQSLAALAELASLVAGSGIRIENPFIFETKRDVVARLSGKASKLVGLTCSCAHTGMFQSKTQWHCGACSQCIDRRIAILHAGLADEDPETDYRTDVFRGAREEGYDKNIAVNYTRHALELSQMGENEIATRFAAELSRAARPLPPIRDSAQRFVGMHARHGDIVSSVLRQEIARSAAALVDGTLPETSLLRLVAGQRHTESTWKQYADRICAILRAGLPAVCQTEKPSTEPRLQEVCDGLLRGAGEKLSREFPFMEWGSSRTKPDWSDERLALWVELKYVREKRDVGPISGAIAEDITRYGDLGRRVLFVVYDPNHHVIDEGAFTEPIHRHDEMFAAIIR